MNEECKIRIISRNLSDLFINYTEHEEEKNWEMFLPLWQAALFEFNVTGTISAEVKAVLNMVSDKSVRFDISIFCRVFGLIWKGKSLRMVSQCLCCDLDRNGLFDI